MITDLTYVPVLRDVPHQLSICEPQRLLVVGEGLPDGHEYADNVRRRPEPDHPLPPGIYQFVSGDGIDVMVVVASQSQPVAADPATASWDAPDSHPLVTAWAWFSAWWPDAEPVTRPLFSAGDPVVTVTRGQEGVIRRREFHNGRWSYQIRLDGRTAEVREDHLSAPIFDDDPFDWVQRDPGDVDRLAATLTRAKLNDQLTDTVYSFRATRTLFRPYQFRPVLRMLQSGRMRLLIADEVGLGKTIEAGLVWTELDARSQANRVLVVCPSALVQKWQMEMDERFGYELDELDAAGLDKLLERIETDRLPTRLHAVCSLERLRIWRGLERLGELAPRFDLVVVDEAHAFRNSDTRSHALGAVLSDWADALVFLSATPLNLGNRDLYNLLELISPGEFDDPSTLELRLEPNALLNRIAASALDRGVENRQRLAWLRQIHTLAFGPAVAARPQFGELESILSGDTLDAQDVVIVKRLVSELHALSGVVTRTRKVEVQDEQAKREVIQLRVEWTPQEAELYSRIEKWQRERAESLGMPVRFVTQMPLRLASSCLPAARDQLLARSGSWSLDVDDESLDPASDETGSSTTIEDDPVPEDLIACAGALGDTDTKFDAFIETLVPMVRKGRRVLVFTFSRSTLAYLERRLGDHVRVGQLHGDVHRADRTEVARKFRAHELDVVVASRVASEGLDFEFCSAVVNYDLPWNPMEVEQRIGRIDRFGQIEEKVYVINFHSPGTIETDIIERVLNRIGVFHDSIGELEPILRDSYADLRRTMFNFELTTEERERRIDEQLAAMENRHVMEAEVESASSMLVSADSAEIDGLEGDLVSSGRYVGQAELVMLLEDWVGGSPGASCIRSPDGLLLTVKGDEALEAQLQGVVAAGERSAAELSQMARSLREHQDIHLSLDQEAARQSGATLLSANHPLVRAALRVPGFQQSRFAHVAITAEVAQPGPFVSLISLARWTGVRPSAEFWIETIDPSTGLDAGQAVGRAVLAALAEGQLGQGSATLDEPAVQSALRSALGQLRKRRDSEDERRRQEGDSILKARRISLQETHSKKVAQINRRIETIRAKDPSSRAIALQQSQLAAQDSYLAADEAKLEASRDGAIEVEHLAVCVVEVMEGGSGHDAGEG